MFNNLVVGYQTVHKILLARHPQNVAY